MSLIKTPGELKFARPSLLQALLGKRLTLFRNAFLLLSFLCCLFIETPAQAQSSTAPLVDEGWYFGQTKYSTEVALATFLCTGTYYDSAVGALKNIEYLETPTDDDPHKGFKYFCNHQMSDRVVVTEHLNSQPYIYSCPGNTAYSKKVKACICQAPNYRYFAQLGYCMGVMPQPDTPEPPPDDCPNCGNPIVIATGAKVQKEPDFATAHVGELAFTRFYDSNPNKPDSVTIHSFGMKWMHTYESFIQPEAALTLNQTRSKCNVSADYQFYFCENNLPTSTTAIPDAVSVTRARGNKIFFARNGYNWQSDLNTNDRLIAQYNADSTAITGWTFTNSSSDDIEQYDAKGRLISITKRNGVVQKLTYSDGTTNDTSVARLPADAPVCTKTSAGAVLARGKLLCVTDNWNHQINFAYDAKGRINNVTDAAGGQYQYAYDGATGGCNTDPNSYACKANNLTSVTYPDSKTRSYVYNEASNINGGTACPYGSPIGSGLGILPNALTGIIDENGKRYASWTYDCSGRATSSEHAGGVEKVALTYGDPDASGSKATTVDTYLGTAANPQKVSNIFQFKALLNTIGHTGLNKPCVNCANTSNKTYDANGNLSSKTDFNGTMTTYEYDLSRNLETKRVEASGTAQAQTTTTTWHASYRLPVQINAPLLRSSFTYDSKGNVLTKTEQTTNDADGSQGVNAAVTGMPRTWTYTYNNAGQVLSITGPRTDVVDKTTYVYDTQGNLSTVTNAAGHVTTLSNYDGNGRVGQITDANGIVTTLTYTPRGWLKKKVTNIDGISETTSYEYDNNGQMTTITLPDNSSISYSYDDAHRLTKISDSLGNSINYTLDNMGNRINETVTDSSGHLTRQISRNFDVLGNLQKVIGGAQ